MTGAPATNELLALADRLDGWADPVSSGYEVPAAGQVMRDAAEALRAAATPSAQGAEPALAQLDSADARSGNLRRVVLDLLNGVAPAVENLACHQEQADADGCMVKVSRQALDEVLSAVNEVAIQTATNLSTTLLPDASPGNGAEKVREALERIPSDSFWLIGKGRLSPNEPMYAAQIKIGLDTISEAEHDDLATAINLACDRAALHSTSAAGETCERCQGNGEIVKDWDAYLHPVNSAAEEAGVAECPDCDGTGNRAAGETTSSDKVLDFREFNEDEFRSMEVQICSETKTVQFCVSDHGGDHPTSPAVAISWVDAVGLITWVRDSIIPSKNIPADVLAMKEACKQAVTELDCMYVNDTRVPYGGIPADPESSAWREAIKAAEAAIDKLSPEVAARARDAELLDFFEKNMGMELSCSWEDDDGPWEVHNVTGGRNDREWAKVGQGATPREAIASAIRTGGQK